MVTTPNKALIDRLVEQAEHHLLAALADGDWHGRDDLGACIPDDLADASLAGLHESVYGDQPDHREFGRFYLADKAVNRLTGKDRIETRRAYGGKEEVRLDPSLMPAPAKNRASPLPTTVELPHPGAAASCAEVTNTGSKPPEAEPLRPAPAVAAPEARTAVADAEVRPGHVHPGSLAEPDVRLVEPDVPVHELAELFPETGAGDYEGLRDDIHAHGQRTPALLYQGKLLDGRTRQRAAKELGLKLAVREWQGAGSPLALVLALNLHRRHLTASQRALVAARLKPRFEDEAQKRRRAGKAPADLRANLPGGRPRDQAAGMLKVSPRSVEMASAVVRKGCAGLVQAVEAGAVSLAAAAELAALSPEQQKQTLAAGKKAVQALAKKLRGRKAEKQGRREETPGMAAGTAEKGSDTLVVCKPTSAAQRQALAKALVKFLGKQECESLAQVWTAKDQRGRPWHSSSRRQ